MRDRWTLQSIPCQTEICRAPVGGIVTRRCSAIDRRTTRHPGYAVGGAGATLPDTMRLVAADVRGAVFAGCGHYMAEEAPRAVAEQLIRFMAE